MTTQSQPTVAPLRAALSWRLLLAWELAALLPSLAALMPLSRQLSELLDFVPHGDKGRLAPALMLDTAVQLGRNFDAVQGGLAASLILALLMAPFAAGLAVASYPEPPGRFFGLLAGAWDNYGRLFRLMIVSLIPYGIAGGLAGAALAAAGKHGEKALLQSSATNGMRLALVITVVLVLLAELSVEAARAQFAVDGALRSALRAWGRGVKLVLARPGAALGRFLVPTIVSLGVAALLVLWRVRASPMLGFVVAQLAVVAIGWGRAGRILALAELARRHAPGRPVE
jgi:hypothetical protein